MYCYVFTAMALAHPHAAGLMLDEDTEAERRREEKPRKRKPPRGGKTMRCRGVKPLGRLEAAVSPAG